MTAPPRIGRLESGPRDTICDVPGVAVGHCTLAAGDVQTGVTVVRPHPDDLFLGKVPAAATILNGFGKSAGLMQVQELGALESPIALTNTFAVGTVARAQIERACREHPGIGRDLGTFNPLVCECNDGCLNDLQAHGVTARHYGEALDGAGTEMAQGSVGAGRGMALFGLKGGVGSASRVLQAEGTAVTLGCLVLTNFGATENLILAGRPLGPVLARRLAERSATGDTGSIIMVLATDASLSDRQLRRVSLRAAAGLARTGSFFGHASGDIALAFSTAYRIPHDPGAPMPALRTLHESALDPLFHAAAEATEQAIVNALFRAATVRGFQGHELTAFLEVLPDWREPFGKAGRQVIQAAARRP